MSWECLLGPEDRKRNVVQAFLPHQYQPLPYKVMLLPDTAYSGSRWKGLLGRHIGLEVRFKDKQLPLTNSSFFTR